MTSPSTAWPLSAEDSERSKGDVSQTCLCVPLQAGPRHGDERVRGPPAQDQELGARRRGRGSGSGRAGQPPACLKSSLLLSSSTVMSGVGGWGRGHWPEFLF